MSKILTFKDLQIWQKGISIAHDTYLLCKKLPKQESFGLTSQMQRASVSIASNIAEGRVRGTKKEFVRFLYIALGSLAELETQLVLAKEIYQLNVEQLIKNIIDERIMIYAIIKKLKTDS